MIDELLLQEIYSLREQLKIATDIVKYYEPDMDPNRFLHDLGAEDYLLYLENNKKEEKLKHMGEFKMKKAKRVRFYFDHESWCLGIGITRTQPILVDYRYCVSIDVPFFTWHIRFG